MLDQLHLGHHGAPEGRAADAPQLLAQRATFGWHTGVSDRDVLLHTLPMFHCNGWGMPYALTGMGARHVVLRKVDGEEILRASSSTASPCSARAGRRGGHPDAAEARAAAGRAVPGRGTVRIVVAGAPPPSKTIERVETELGWEFIQIYGLTETSPLLTINRAPAEWDGLDAGARSLLLSRAGVPALGVRIDIDDEGEVLARSNHVFAGYWEQPEETATALEGGWFHTGDGGYLDGRASRHLGPQEGRHHHRRGERLLHRDGGLPLPARRRGRGGGDRRARREMGRDDQGARGAARGDDGHRGRAHRVLPRPPGPLQGADQRGAS